MKVLGVRSAAAPGEAAPVSLEVPEEDALRSNFVWLYGHVAKPRESQVSLFDLEGIVARRMELLAAVDRRLNTPSGDGTEAVADWLDRAFRKETSYHLAAAKRSPQPKRESSEEPTPKRLPPDHNLNADALEGSTFYFSPDEEVIGHQLCRYAFCTSEKWRAWFIKMEEMVYNGRLRALLHAAPKKILSNVLSAAKVPYQPLPKGNPQATRGLLHLNKHRKNDLPPYTDEDVCLIPFQHVLRSTRRRDVVCANGYAVIAKKDLVEAVLARYRAHLAQSLAAALRKRSEIIDEDDTERLNVYTMVDSFLERFVVNPGDTLKETPAGVVMVQDIPHLARVHMPLCMSRIDQQLRANGHLKHHGRWMLGLFLKAIGLSLEHSLEYWQGLMTVKGGGGSVEHFKKTEYGYGIRHMYGQEGKRTSYSSLSCTTIVAMGPEMDRHDCHGCPFRFKSEADLRGLLKAERINPVTHQAVHIGAGDIEDIVADCKGSHFTRACYRFYLATHQQGPARDNLFRSPYEYYTISVEAERFGETLRKGGESEADRAPLAERGHLSGGEHSPAAARKSARTVVSSAPPDLDAVQHGKRPKPDDPAQ